MKNRLEIIPVQWIDQVLEIALERMPEPLPDDDVVAPAAPVAPVIAAEPHADDSTVDQALSRGVSTDHRDAWRRATRFFCVASRQVDMRGSTTAIGLTPQDSHCLMPVRFDVRIARSSRVNAFHCRPARHAPTVVINIVKRDLNEQIGTDRAHRQAGRHLKAAAGRALESVVGGIKTTLKKNGSVTLVGFGTFYRRQAHGAHGTQSAHRRIDQDQGREGSEVPRWKSAERCGKLAGCLCK